MNEYEMFLALMEKHPEWLERIRADERRKCEEEFKQALKRYCINGTVAYRVIDDVLTEYEKEQEQRSLDYDTLE